MFPGAHRYQAPEQGEDTAARGHGSCWGSAGQTPLCWTLLEEKPSPGAAGAGEERSSFGERGSSLGSQVTRTSQEPSLLPLDREG